MHRSLLRKYVDDELKRALINRQKPLLQELKLWKDKGRRALKVKKASKDIETDKYLAIKQILSGRVYYKRAELAIRRMVGQVCEDY